MNINIKKIIIIITICLLISTSFSNSSALQKNNDKNSNQHTSNNTINNVTIATCYIFNPDGITSTDKIISYETGLYLVKLFKESNDNLLKKTELINTLNDLGFINDKSLNLIKPRWLDNIKPFKSSSTGTSFFCSIASAGAGKTTPLVLLPRPRGILSWKGYEDPQFAITTVGSLTKNKGFIARGSQQGTAIGFVGLGITYGTPYGTIYVFTGYALYTSVTAEDIDFYPPNNKPQISSPYPSNGEENVPLTLSELSFRIDDADNDLMSYSVITNPDIGSGSKSYIGNGVYSITINELQPSTKYTWTVKVTDGKDNKSNDFDFTTVSLAPIITDPYPSDGSTNVLIEQSSLSFSISDPQNDPMDYTVETTPYIGSKSEINVPAGRYEVPIYNLKYNTFYSWYVNVTDGTNWKKEKFTFTTLPEGLILLYPIDDTTIMMKDPDDNYGDSNTMTIRNRYGSSSHPDYWERDILIKFDLSSIPSNTEIVFADLYLFYYKYYDNNPSGQIVKTYRITQNWDEETVTWDNQPKTSSLETSQLNMPESADTWLSWDVTNDVKNFVSRQYVNYGWMLKDTSYWGSLNIPLSFFWSKEHGEFIPYLEIGINP